MAFPALVARLYLVQISYTEFHPNWTTNVRNWASSSVNALLSKNGIDWAAFRETHNHITNFTGNFCNEIDGNRKTNVENI
jgi:hypothetical protein